MSEPIAQDKHASILNVSIQVFAAQGFQGTDVQVIADKAGVGKGTVYRYFGDKESLFWETWLEVCRRLNDRMTSSIAPEANCIAILRAAVHAEGLFFEEHPDCLEILVQGRAMFHGRHPEKVQDYLQQTFTEPFIAIFRQAVEQGELRNVDPSDLHWALSATLYGTMLQQAFRADSIPLSDRLTRTFDLLIEGFQPHPTL